jgi:hypothetical protein
MLAITGGETARFTPFSQLFQQALEKFWAGRLLGTQRQGAVTAFLTATLLRPVAAAAPHISYAWVLAESGRKHTLGVALATADGELCAVAEALWLDPRPAA